MDPPPESRRPSTESSRGSIDTKMSKYSSMELPPKAGLEEEEEEEEEEEKGVGRGEESGPVSLSALFSTRTMTRITLVMWVNWVVVTIGYYGISLGIGEIGSDIFINFLLVSLIEIPSYVFVLLTMDHLGRKPLYVCSILLTGVGCLVAAFLEDGNAKTSLSIIGTATRGG